MCLKISQSGRYPSLCKSLYSVSNLLDSLPGSGMIHNEFIDHPYMHNGRLLRGAQHSYAAGFSPEYINCTSDNFDIQEFLSLKICSPSHCVHSPFRCSHLIIHKVRCAIIMRANEMIFGCLV